MRDKLNNVYTQWQTIVLNKSADIYLYWTVTCFTWSWHFMHLCITMKQHILLKVKNDLSWYIKCKSFKDVCVRLPFCTCNLVITVWPYCLNTHYLHIHIYIRILCDSSRLIDCTRKLSILYDGVSILWCGVKQRTCFCKCTRTTFCKCYFPPTYMI